MDGSIVKRALARLEAGAAFSFERLSRCLSPETASGLGGWVLRGIGPAIGAGRVARRNLRRAFPGRDVEGLLGEVWANLGRTLFEYPHLVEMHRRGLVEFHGLDVIARLKAEGRGGVFFSGHQANWECVPMLAEEGGFEAAVMYRAPNNAYVADLISRCRSAQGVRFIPKSLQGTKTAFSVLAAGGFVGVLIDHRYNRGIEVDFLGGRAVIAPTLAVMARRFRCPAVPIRVERTGAARYRVTVHEPLPVDYALPAAAFQADVMQRAFAVLESWIRERPEQWFWMQRLWR